MTKTDEYSKFTSSLSKFINRQWSKVKSSTTSLKSTKIIDEALEEEYETLLREIDYLVSEKSCYLSYKNDRFSSGKSSEDLTKILKNHSEEVLRTYIAQHGKDEKRSSLINQTDLVNYVTKIVVSRPKCNNKLCSCKPIKSSKEVLTDGIELSQNAQTKGSQAKHVTHQSTQKPGDDGKSSGDQATEVENDKKDQDSKTESQGTSKSVSTMEKPLQDASTSDRKVTSSKNVFANCIGETGEAQTSTNRLCVPENFEKLLKSKKLNKFTTCVGKQDCECEAYDVKEALKRGLVLPSSDICIKKQKISPKEKEKTSKKGKKPMSSDDNETTADTSSDDAAKQSKKKEKEKIKKEKKDKKKVDASENLSSNNSTPREKPKKEKRGTTGCFGSKKKTKRGCDENCQGIVRRQQSMQTLPIRTSDKNEEAYPYGRNNGKSVHTSTNSDTATQVSAHPSRENSKKKNMQDKDVSSIEHKATGRSHEQIQNKTHKAEKNTDNREQESNIPKEGAIVCSKCGRQKRDCSSGCRNTIIIPYGTGSNNALPPGDAESLRMLIKMHNKDTSRQFDNLMAELNHQKSEIRRLNDMYHKMMGSFYDLQKSAGGSRSYKTSDISHESSNNYDGKKRNETAKPCGCSFSNQCKISNQNESTGKSNSFKECVCNDNSNNNNAPVRRFGPPNTAVAINLCDTCNVEIAATRQFTREQDYYGGDKLRKDQLNQSKKAIRADQNITIRTGNTALAGNGDFNVRGADSVSTIYKNDKKGHKTKSGPNIDKRSGHENLLKCKNINANEEDKEEDETLRSLPKIHTKTDSSDESEPGKRPRNIYSSRVLIWLKKSWISIKHKTEECRHKEKVRREKAKAMHHVFNFCQSTARKAAEGMWKSMKKTPIF